MRLASVMFLALNGLAVFAQNALPNLRPPYFPKPADNYFTNQWHLERRDFDGVRTGPDLNVRGAWSLTKGEGVIVAVCDDGIEFTHRDLAANILPELSFDFDLGIPGGEPRTDQDNHGTAAAGLVAAALNGIGTIGVAPAAKLASWIIYPTNITSGRTVIAPAKMAQVFANQNDTVAIQLHNWAETKTLYRFFAQTAIESDSISNAVTLGRQGKGVVIVRPAGNVNIESNGDFTGRNLNDDAFASDPRVITAGATRTDGRVASYSTRGACLLVCGLSGDTPANADFLNLFTTDRTGMKGYNFITFPTEPERADYVYGSFGFGGTSASAPTIAGICALILSANPNLSYRDVQQVLIHSSRQFDKADPDLRRNGAGYWFSHRQGYGVPDAGEAVRVAIAWKNRPAMVRLAVASDVTTNVPIPDASLAVVARALSAVPAIATNFVAFPSPGLQPDDPTPDLPLVDVGLATNTITQDLHGKGALIQRGVVTFESKIENAAAAGAAFAIVYNNVDSPPLAFMGGTEYAPIPTVSISRVDGEKLQNLITNQASLRVQLRGEPARARFDVTQQLLCEHIGVRVRTTNVMRQDLRITLVSPMGSRSILQAFNLDTTAGPVDWTYWSTEHFYELSSGTWTLEVTDEVEGSAGDLLGADLIVEGTPIEDSDDDSLDDRWEMANFGNLNQGALDDPDHDGSWNAREQALGTNPNVDETPFLISASDLQPNATRFAFPSIEGLNYTIRSSVDLNGPFTDIGTTVGQFGETEIVWPKTDPARFFLVRRP
jgi:subtilisin family serine protease/subtilisin-like proprotein convertase family protein